MVCRGAPMCAPVHRLLLNDIDLRRMSLPAENLRRRALALKGFPRSPHFFAACEKNIQKKGDCFQLSESEELQWTVRNVTGTKNMNVCPKRK